MSRLDNEEAHEEAGLFDVPGGWALRAITLAGRSFELILPADPDSVLESQLAADRSQAGEDRPAEADGATVDPYWAALWSAAIPTAEAVLRADWRCAERVLELGCGVGLVGLAALACGLQVTFSDCARRLWRWPGTMRCEMAIQQLANCC